MAGIVKLTRDLSRLEMMLAFVIIGVLITVFMQQLDTIASRTEQVRFINTMSALRQGLNNLLMQYMVTHDDEGIAALNHNNPYVTALTGPYEMGKNGRPLATGEVVHGYLGKYREPLSEDLASGNWLYNQTTGHLVYLVRNSEYFQTDLDGRPRIRIAVSLQYNDRNGDKRYSKGEPVSGVSVRILDQVKWHGQSLY
jgi:hypothetical protein